MKHLFVTITTLLFLFASLIMPYGNFDDTHSLQIVYNTCLAKDVDMNLMEFVGEKLLGLGLEGNEEEEEVEIPIQSKQPINTEVFIQIQSGVMFRQSQYIFTALAIPLIRTSIPLLNTDVPSDEFHPNIFHPPITKTA